MVFIAVLSLVGAGFVLHSRSKEKRMFSMQLPGGTLAPGDVPKFVTALVKPPAMPPSKGSNKNKDRYRIAVRQFQQQILPTFDENNNPTGLPKTTVWSYGSIDFPGTVAENGTFHYPAFTIEATYGKEAQILWRNDLKDEMGNYLPHLLPVDPTLHWANPPGGLMGRDTRPPFNTTPGPYTGPVPMVTHVHGAHTYEQFDGYPEAWYLPDAKNIPAGYATTGTFYDYFKAKYGESWSPGTVSFKYPNDQRATTLWYHDHTLGMTRLNVYAGPAGFYLIRGGPDDVIEGVLPGPAPGVGDDPYGEYGEIPIVIQDRSFNDDGSLFYPDTREFFDAPGWAGPYIPDSLIPPIWQPEFFGNMMVVNGYTWPYLEVERKRYRFRFLNGCNSRFLILKMTETPRNNNLSFNVPDLSFWQIGSEGGFLPDPVELPHLLMAPAERADVIVDFSGYEDGDVIYLVNDGPDAPFGGITLEDISDWESTGLVMKVKVSGEPVDDPSTPPDELGLPAITPLGDETVNPYQLSLNEEEDPMYPEAGPSAALLGTYDTATMTTTPLLWSDPITENPPVGAVQMWEIYNFTEDAHPIHVHLVQFQVVNRQPIEDDTVLYPETWESGFKDTVIAYPGEITRIKAKFDVPGIYVWHCHIVEHEDNEMMRPYAVGPYVMPMGVELRRIK
jgi:spore coat protein A